MLAIATLWRREVIRFSRQRSRLLGALAQPLVFWLLLGGGLSPSFRPPGAPAGASYLAYLYPGILALVLLFTAIFADRKSTRLNSSHPSISYAVFCLKKKKNS